ncbi:MAG TPA: S9 family peptidase [Gemmatimonadales bacterium]|jgi:dipeptidyl aminopeptidase/acylaminoacyl peptidase|nr:S9 family peptidase [Gemmatimonadales bacterium]
MMGKLALIAAGAVSLLATPGSLLAQKQPITFETFLALQISGDPRLSPDGRTVAFTVTVPSLQDNRNVSRVWIAPVAGGTPKQLTNGPGTDLAPRWAPDGHAVAFVSTRGGSPQVWTVDLAGGTVSQVTNIESGVNDFFWAADGRSLYVTSDVKWPVDGQEIDRRNGAYPTQARIWDNLFYRHWNEWRAGLRSHVLRAGLTDKSVTDLTPIDRDVPTLALGGNDVAADTSGNLLVTYNNDADVAQSTNNDIFLVRGGNRQPEQITTRQGNDNSPAFSPDGQLIAYLSMETPGFEADRQQLMVYERAGRRHRSLTATWDLNIVSFAWAPNSRTLVLEVEERGNHNLYTLDVASMRRTRIVGGGLNSNPQVSPDGSRVVFLRQSATLPPEIFTVGVDGTGLHSLAPLNAAALAGLDLAPLESFSFVGALGDSVQSWLLKPPGFNPARKYPLLYIVHGGPQVPMLDYWGARWNYHMFASRGYVVAVVNFHGTPGWGQKFVNSISKHWGDYPYEDLMKGLDVVAALPYVDSTRMGAAGASYGGYMINWMEGHTDRFKAMVSHDGIFNLASAQGASEELWFPNHEFGPGGVTNPETRAMLDRWSPHMFAERWKTPMLVVHGQQDFRLELSEGLQAFTALKIRNVPAKMLYFPDEGHWVLKPRNRRIWWDTLLDWMDTYLRPGATNNTP